MQVGDRVKFFDPSDPYEAEERFIVVENRGDRILVELITRQFRIRPTFVYPAGDLVVVE